jgi:Phage capsid protein
MAIALEIWSKDIENTLYSDQTFLSYFRDESGFISQNGKILHLPQAGTPSTIQVDPVFAGAGLAATQRIDTDAIFTLKSYVIPPVAMQFSIDDLQISYNKRESIFGESFSNIGQRIGDDALFATSSGLPAGQIISTTGTASNSALGISATGTRNKLTVNDLYTAAAILDKQNIKSTDRYAVLESGMYWQLMTDVAVQSALNYGSATLPTGVVNEIAGFKIIKRDRTLQYATGGALKDFNISFTGAATDNIGCFVFQKDAVLKGDGSINVYENSSDANYLGDVMSFRKMFIAGRRRSDNKGVVIIRQA